jgi:hypothetical protein
MRLPCRYAPFIYGTIQAAITSAVASAIATANLTGDAMQFVRFCLPAWGLAWIIMLPVVLLIAPAIQRDVHALTTPGEGTR